jgi:GTP-binding protein
MPNIVAIVGRPNVGKSTLFNRLTESREAIVDEEAGVTRDRHYGKTNWNGVEFSIVDTGGYIKGSDDVFESEIRKQVQIAVDECTSILFLVDVAEGITQFDKEVASVVRKSKKPVMLLFSRILCFRFRRTFLYFVQQRKRYWRYVRCLSEIFSGRFRRY